MATFFFYGTLCHAPLLSAVLGRSIDARPARLAGHAVHWAEGGAFPLIVPAPGAAAAGVVAAALTDADVARLDYYEGGFDYATRDVALDDGTFARVYFPAPGSWRPGAPWRLADWVARYGAVAVETATDFMRHFGLRPAPEVRRRYPMMMVRAASRLRAARPAPPGLRHAAGPGDVAVVARREPYANYFSVEEFDLRHRRFDGGDSGPMTRAAFVSGDAATVLPYDPRRDRVLLVEQFRTGPFARGDANPWLLEAIAGRIDAGETPEDAARREAEEEAGIALGALLPVAQYYPSPGAKTEFLYSFVALADLPDDAAGLGGMADEHEDIRAHLLSFEALMRVIETPDAANGPLILTALWMAARRDGLRRAAGVA
jgi:nudix-type nucleoside diphosphatase (YffH/AdpP family)